MKIGIWSIAKYSDGLSGEYVLFHKCKDGEEVWRVWRVRAMFNPLTKPCTTCNAAPSEEIVNFYEILTLPL